MGYLDGKSANKGEWSEVYVFLKLLGEGRLYAADEHLKRKPGYYVEVLKVMREEIAGEISEYERNGAMVDIVADGVTVASVPAKDFLDNARLFFDYLADSRGSSIVVSDDLAKFSHVIRISKVKSPSMRDLAQFGGKSDIVIMTRDGRSSLVSTMGFSIKSQFGSAPTLYNAGTSTQFEFEVKGMDDAGMVELNEMDQHVKGNRKWTAVSRLYRERGWQAVYRGTPNSTTAENFFLIRDSMPELMAWVYRRAFLEDYPNSLDFVTLSHALSLENPLGYPSGAIYEKALKDFLFASFSGMTGGVAWDGTEQVNGGYIVVKPDGDVLCYHANDREQFRDYLFTQTHIEYVSRKKYRWGSVYKTPDGKYMLPLNGSVRFYPTYRELPGSQHVVV